MLHELVRKGEPSERTVRVVIDSIGRVANVKELAHYYSSISQDGLRIERRREEQNKAFVLTPWKRFGIGAKTQSRTTG